MAIQASQPGVDEEKDKKEDVGALPQTSSSGAPSGGGAPVQQSAPATDGPTSSGQFTDAGKFISANKGRAGQFAQSAADKVRDQLATGQESLQTEADKFQQDIQGSASDVTPYMGKSASQMDVSGAREILTGGKKVLSPDQIALQQIAGIDRAGQLADLSQTHTGREVFLGETIAPQIKGYSEGERSLDAMFLGRDKAAQQQLAGLRSEASQAGEQARGLQENLRKQATEIAASNKGAASDLAKSLESQFGKMQANNALYDETSRMDAAVNSIAGMRGELAEKYRTDRESMTPGEISLLNYMNQAAREKDENGNFINGDYASRGARNFINNILGNADESTLNDTTSATQGQLLGLLTGYDASKQAELEAIKSLTEGTQYGNMSEAAQNILSGNSYSQEAALNRLMDYLREGNAGLNYGGGGNYLPG